MLKDRHTILKPLSDREFDFYELLKKQSPDAPFIEFFPHYYGCRSVEAEDGEHNRKLIFFVNFCILLDSLPRIDYIVLEDLTSGLEGPCVCDLKIGARGIIFFYLFIFNTDQLLHFRI